MTLIAWLGNSMMFGCRTVCVISSGFPIPGHMVLSGIFYPAAVGYISSVFYTLPAVGLCDPAKGVLL